MNHETIINYYNYTLLLYRVFYHGKSYGVHYGFWDDTINNHQEAILNTNKYMATLADIKPNDKILDAGCGVGGSAIWLAKNINTNVTGITLSNQQLKKAKQLANRNGVENNTQFHIMDYLNTSFEDETFDIVWAIESVCYSINKHDFISEAYRILKKGGKLIVCDGFKLRNPQTKEEEKWYSAFLEGWALQNLAGDVEFEQHLTSVGFKNIQKINKVKEAMPSAKKIYNISRYSYPLSLATEKLGLTPSLLTKNNLAGKTQLRIIENGIMGHYVFCGIK